MAKVRFINIIRVLGLFLVLTYHLFCEFLPGGFLGVDVFFTFSGYLVTSLIILTFENKGNFDFFYYIKRRLSRIFPVLIFSILFTLPFVKLVSSDFTANIDKQVAAALGFVTNYYEILMGGSYESQLVPHLYIHTWSLALEFHYYLIWGMFATFLTLIIIRLKNIVPQNKLKVFKAILLASAAFFAVISYLNMQYLFSANSNISVAYLATTSHIYPFFIGSILGALFGLKLPSEISNWLKQKASSLKYCIMILIPTTLAAIVILCRKTNFKNDFTYKYGFLIASILSAILILATRILHEITPASYKEPRLITHIANISYPMYLFHFPLFTIFSNALNSQIAAAISTLIIAYIFSVLVFYNIEPIFYRASYMESKKFNGFRKSIITTVIICLSTTCGIINTNIFINKKDISALEEEQMVGNIVQNIDKIEELKKGIDNVNAEPFLQKDGIQDFDNLKINSKQKQTVGLNAKRNNHISETTSKATAKKEEFFSLAEKALNINAKVTIIGDSVALGARKKLTETISDSYVDTKKNRTLAQGYNIMMDLQKSDSLGEYVVIALGTNGCNNWELYIEKIINELSPGHRLIFVTPYDGRWNESWNSYKTTQYLRSLNDKYPFVTIIDWAAEISKCPELLGSDKTHIGGNTKAIKIFVDKIVDGINESSSKSAK